MKFTVFGLLAFAVCAQSGVVPYAAWPYTATAWGHAAPLALSAPITQYSTLPLAPQAPISYAAHVAAPHAIIAAPHSIVDVHHAHHVVATPAVIPVGKAAATYTAVNRGSVHTAPLEGHAISQTSLNLAPAPGTL